MEEQTKDDVIVDIREHIKEDGYTLDMLNKWCCGITNDTNERLFGYHFPKNSYTRDDASWIRRKCKSKADAQFVEKLFLDAGCKGGTGGGKPDSVFVYAYKIMPYTVQ